MDDYPTSDRYEIAWLLLYGMEPTAIDETDTGKRDPKYTFYFDGGQAKQLLAEYRLSQTRDFVRLVGEIRMIARDYITRVKN